VREGGGEGGRERVCMRLSVIVSYIYKHTYVQVRQHNSALAHNPVNPPLQRAADYEGSHRRRCAAEAAEVPRWWPGRGGDFHVHLVWSA
jgi:hypothetical protein